MKEVFYIDDTPANKISYYFMLVFLVALPFDRLFSELALIGLLLHTVIHWRRPGGERRTDDESPFRGQRPSWIWLCATLYVLTMLSTIWSDQLSLAFKEWEKQLALLLFPLIAYFTRLDWRRYRFPLLKALAFSCFFTTLYLYGIAFGRIYKEGLPIPALFSRPFMNHRFSEPIDLHATYFSMYIAISLVTFIRLMLCSRKSLVRWGYALASFILLVAILQLATRAVCIAVLIILNGVLPFWLMSGRIRRIFLPVALLSTICCLTAVVRNEHLRTRYLVQLQQDLKDNIGDKDGPEPRMARWLCAWELIRASPWIGYGTGTEVDLLKQKYATHQLNDSYAHDLNAHNQYLSFFLKTGIFGVLLYLVILAIGFRQAFRLQDPFLTSFMIIITCVSASENILDVNKGIFFFSFFFSFFLCRPDSAETDIFELHYGNKNTLPLMGA